MEKEAHSESFWTKKVKPLLIRSFYALLGIYAHNSNIILQNSNMF